LLKGKIVLPDTLKDFDGELLYKIYDDIPIEKSAETEALLGDLKYAAIIKDERDVELFAKGKERLYFVNSKIDEREFVAKELDGGYLIKKQIV